jgi:hypothetical protein
LRAPTTTIAVALLVCGALRAAIAPAASYYCSEPSEPMCIGIVMSSEAGFESESDFQLCKMQVERYLVQWDNWVECHADEATDKKNEAVEAFNCRARGGKLIGSVCFE